MIELMRNYLYDKTPEIFFVTLVIKGICKPQRTPSPPRFFFYAALGVLYGIFFVMTHLFRII